MYREKSKTTDSEMTKSKQNLKIRGTEIAIAERRNDKIVRYVQRYSKIWAYTMKKMSKT